MEQRIGFRKDGDVKMKMILSILLIGTSICNFLTIRQNQELQEEIDRLISYLNIYKNDTRISLFRKAFEHRYEFAEAHVTKYRNGKVAKVSPARIALVLPYHDWCELEKSYEMEQLKKVLSEMKMKHELESQQESQD